MGIRNIGMVTSTEQMVCIKNLAVVYKTITETWHQLIDNCVHKNRLGNSSKKHWSWGYYVFICM